MTDPTPILALHDALLPASPGGAAVRCSFTVEPGETVTAVLGSPALVRSMGDLCAGLTPPASGAVRLLGHDWAGLGPAYADALRGVIGWWTGVGLFPSHLPVLSSVLLPGAYHSRLPLEDLAERASRLARRFGLPGLPTIWPDTVSSADRIRAACVQVFINDPQLVILSLTAPLPVPLVPPMLACIADVRLAGGGALVLARDAAAAEGIAASASRHLILAGGRLEDPDLAVAGASP